MDKAMEFPSIDKKRLAGHRVPRRAIVPLLLIAGLAAWWYYSSFAVPAPVGIPASGSIEAEEVSISSELAGRVTQLLAEEGDQVKAGDVLVKLDDSTLKLQHRMAQVAERQLLELQLEKTSIRSPMDGVVYRRSIRVGEVATPGAVLMTVGKLDQVELTLYVREGDIGRVRVDQPVSVQVDSFPGETFQGRVSFIASKAEFTPRNVQTQKDRLNLVFAVKVKIPNPDLRLKPGVPADATILDQ